MVTRRKSSPFEGLKVLRPQSKQPVVANKLQIQDDEPDTEGRVQQLPWSLIVLPEKQPRRYFDEAELEKLAVSIREHGILTPLLVRPKGAEQYELVAGERRYRAAKKLALAELPVLIREMTDDEALEIALLENLQREDLNPVEETEAILDLLSQRLTMSREAVISLLNRGANRKRESVQNVLHSPEWKLVERVFGIIGRFTPQSFRASRLPLLRLPEEILVALQQGQLKSYSKAGLLGKVQDAELRSKLLQLTIGENLSLSKLKQLVVSKQTIARSQSAVKPSKKVEQLWKQLKASDIWQDSQKVNQLIAVMNELLGIDSSAKEAS